ncbi:histidine phosphatase family protein [Corynebacterium sp. sy039]|uniref:histidine phosphatase family protein n=1 Tax=Corynebacterium sp. sy039 TaxID=2599641 RepID=UPI0011B3F855|nr:histidine phosphatase family protein [Corynebacterium sp. sy039]QDZ43063.1 histidine phosphatase family protein [Corynebacterium sp. sy039]
MPRRLLLLRHGQTQYNANKRMQGHLDTELAERGIAQAQLVSDFLASQPIKKIIASDLQRARVTAEIIDRNIGVGVEIDQRLRETNLGQWQGKTHEEVDAAYPGARARWRNDASWTPPGGESRLSVAQRARAVIDELVTDYPQWDDEDTTVLVVAHGGTISALTSSLLELHPSQYPLFSGLGNTCWSALIARPRFGCAPATDEPVQWYLEGWNMGVYATDTAPSADQ